MVKGSLPPPRASLSDGGVLKYRGGAIYASDMLDDIDKIHMVISVPTCECVAAVDVQKINQLDYMLDMGHLFSYAVYVNEGGFHDRSHCSIPHESVQRRTDLKFGVISGDGMGVGETSRPIFAKRIEGTVLSKAIEEFNNHEYIKDNHAEIFGTDKSGGILFTQGNVEIRPCLLFPWYMPWIYDDYNTDHVVNMSDLDGSEFLYYEAEDAVVFNEIVDDMKHSKVITQKHLVNLEDNTGSEELLRIFSFQALFIPHRFTHEFNSLLRPFSDTGLSPFVYVPYVFQLMFDKNEWLHFQHSDKNETLRLGTWPLLVDCLGETVDDMHVFDRAASDLHYYAAQCGGGDSIFVVVEKIVTEIEIYTGMTVYRVLFFVLLSIVILCILCIFRRPIFEALRRWRRGAGIRFVEDKKRNSGYEMGRPMHVQGVSEEEDEDDEMIINKD